VVIQKKDLAKFGYYGPDMKVENLFETIFFYKKRLLHFLIFLAT
jgi:hypothetical protein